MSSHRSFALLLEDRDVMDLSLLNDYPLDLQRMIVGYLLDDLIGDLTVLPQQVTAPYQKLLHQNVFPLMHDASVRELYYNLPSYLPTATQLPRVTLITDLVDSALGLLGLQPQQLILYLAEMTRNVSDSTIATTVNHYGDPLKPAAVGALNFPLQDNRYLEPIAMLLQSLTLLSFDASHQSEASRYLQWRLISDFRQLVQDSISNAYQDSCATVQDDDARQLAPALKFTSSFGLFSKLRSKQQAKIRSMQAIAEEKNQRTMLIALVSALLCWTLSNADLNGINKSDTLLTAVLWSLLLAAGVAWSSVVYFTLIHSDSIQHAELAAGDLGSDLLSDSLQKLNQALVPQAAATPADTFTLFSKPRKLVAVDEIAVHEKLIELTQASNWKSWTKNNKFNAWLEIDDEIRALELIATLKATDALSAFYLEDKTLVEQAKWGILVVDVECEKLLAQTSYKKGKSVM